MCINDCYLLQGLKNKNSEVCFFWFQKLMLVENKSYLLSVQVQTTPWTDCKAMCDQEWWERLSIAWGFLRSRMNIPRSIIQPSIISILQNCREVWQVETWKMAKRGQSGLSLWFEISTESSSKSILFSVVRILSNSSPIQDYKVADEAICYDSVHCISFMV